MTSDTESMTSKDLCERKESEPATSKIASPVTRRKIRMKKYSKTKSKPTFLSAEEYQRYHPHKFEDFINLLGPTLTEICKMKLARGRKKNTRYTPHQIYIGCEIYAHTDAKTYEYLSNILPLPSLSTTKRILRRKGLYQKTCDKITPAKLPSCIDDQIDDSVPEDIISRPVDSNF